MANVHDYFSAQTFVLGGRDKRSRPIENNTRVEARGWDATDAYAIRLHATDVVTFRADGWVILSTGGWDTVTTWSRINGYLPGPWAVHSQRGTRWLHRSGRPITPYADGLSVNPTTGEVGMDGDTLLTAADVDAIVAAADAAAQVRAEKRAARLLREHPAVGAPRSHRGYDHRSYDCDRCRAELDAEREAERARLHAEHTAMAATFARNPDTAAPWTEAEYTAAGSHVRRETVTEWPALPGETGPYPRRDYSAEPTRSERVTIACPWPCPDRY